MGYILKIYLFYHCGYCEDEEINIEWSIMKTQMVGYIRVSSLDQNTARQLDGINLDRIFTDKISGKDMERPQLLDMLAYVRTGDTVLVHSMDRLARNLNDLRTLVQTMTAKGVRVQFIKENLSFTGEDSAIAHLLLSVMGAVAEFERAKIKERQLEGIALAKQRNVYKGRKRILDVAAIQDIKERVLAGHKKAHIARDYNISRDTLYSYLRLSSEA